MVLINPHYNRNSAGRNHWPFPRVSETSEGTSIPGRLHAYLFGTGPPFHLTGTTCRPWSIARGQTIGCERVQRQGRVWLYPTNITGGGHRSQLCYKASGDLSSPVSGSAQGWPPKYRWPLNNTGLNCAGHLYMDMVTTINVVSLMIFLITVLPSSLLYGKTTVYNT